MTTNVMEKLTGKAWTKFLETQKAPATKDLYRLWIEQFIAFTGCKDADGLLTLGTTHDIEDRIISWLGSMNNKASMTLRTALAAVSFFYRQNRLQPPLNVKYIGERIPKKPGKAHRAPTLEELQAIINSADVRGKAIVNGLLAPAGLRIGAVPGLKQRHIRKLKPEELEHNNCTCADRSLPLKFDGYLIRVYDGEKEQYFSFTTEEGAAAIDRYLAYRERTGEQLNPNSPIIRAEYDVTDPEQANAPRPLTQISLTHRLAELELAAGVRKAVDIKDRRERPGYRHEFKTAHGFRAYFNTTLQNAKCHGDFRHLLMGHKSTRGGLDKAYYDDTQPASVHAALAEYLKAADALTLFSTAKLERENAVLQERVGEIERLKAEMEKVKADLVELVRAGTKSGEIIPETKKE